MMFRDLDPHTLGSQAVTSRNSDSECQASLFSFAVRTLRSFIDKEMTETVFFRMAFRTVGGAKRYDRTAGNSMSMCIREVSFGALEKTNVFLCSL